MTTLGIDTSNQTMALCLEENGKIIGTQVMTNQKNHSISLMPGIDFLLSINQKKPKDLTKIIIAEGPGSYTGLRIGVTTAKTLAWTLGVELYAVSSLALIAASNIGFEGLIVSIINARRENVYTGAYKWEDGKLVNVIEDQHIAMSTWLDKLSQEKEQVLFIGIDVLVFKEMIDERNITNFIYNSLEYNNLLSGESFLRADNVTREITNIDGFVPSYLKKVEAEEKWLEMNKEQEGSDYVQRV
ncbi:tRNA (adenosine(37)-N6)-threonylcarbamoyltransferase complex dimerization subunit type 1 TsaB [Vagococcus fluvialis]|uniref:tRNA (adenosine(37)-N6)-threonylcarbamoyltransferase complex dimerization subunit type 1 TsaB n=1 Tax=Vagococcus fluvialis TaxID=2738 RepID=UPI001A8C702D|nr:tRNA (adenosine(37)-N6)-threonylcarbamoyltransferase complex dimerization subunit type 1 TsaB [Vagococcus fluvialis]MBO0428863.1 tRNA (adenosine(37)-N6)-threonylcarbamoyltransferase complex dimerization subunit type 1 TsaB [Vagococcus fluvialis]